jgi:hypothetical protein
VDAPEPLRADEELLWRSLMQLLIRIPRVTDNDIARDSKLATSEYVVPSSEGCEDCLRIGGLWVHLRMRTRRYDRRKSSRATGNEYGA